MDSSDVDVFYTAELGPESNEVQIQESINSDVINTAAFTTYKSIDKKSEEPVQDSEAIKRRGRAPARLLFDEATTATSSKLQSPVRKNATRRGKSKSKTRGGARSRSRSNRGRSQSNSSRKSSTSRRGRK